VGAGGCVWVCERGWAGVRVSERVFKKCYDGRGISVYLSTFIGLHYILRLFSGSLGLSQRYVIV